MKSFFKRPSLALSILAALMLFNGLYAAAADTDGVVLDQVTGKSSPSSLNQALSGTQNWNSGGYGKLPASDSGISNQALLPFGSQLFDGGFRGLRADGLNSEYLITPGDLVVLRIWGAVSLEQVIPVDARGNVFIPSIGPVKVKGLSHKAFDSRIRGAVRSVYPENVHVYTQVQGVQPVGVFVTGYVAKPGQYAGTPHDSAIYFLDQAGGVDAALGSYRIIELLRNGELIETIDLYRFLLDGQMPRVQFRDGDTLVVKERLATVAVAGDVEREYQYELKPNEMIGRELMRLARKKPGVSHVLLHSEKAGQPFSDYLALSSFDDQPLVDGDELQLSIDKRDEMIVVEVEGSYYGPSRYSLPRSFMLHDLLNEIAVPEDLTDVTSISMRRESVALRQKTSLDESLRRLESTYLGASSSTPQEASIRVQEAQLISRFIEKASLAEPNGRLVVASNDQIANIRLQNGDVITIPEKADSLLISGEILVPQSVVYAAGMSVEDYIKGAGGFSQHADEDQILIIRQNGEVRDADEVDLKPGDEILVLPKVPTKNLQLATSITQILYQLAVSAKVINDL